MSLNSSQELSLKQIRKTLLSNRPLKLEAPAGFGKTYLLRHFLKHCPFSSVLVLTETNQALRVLQADLNLQNVKTEVTFKTVCSALNYVLESTHEGYRLKQKAEPDWRGYDLVIVDEGSQLSSSRWEEVKQNAKRLLISGDSCQAPPVGEVISPVWAEAWEQTELTIPMRNTSDIYKYCLQLRNIIGTNKKFPMAFVNSPLEFYENMESSLVDFHRGDALILAFSERGQRLHAVADYNAHIVNSLFGDHTVFHAGQRIVFKKPYIPFVKNIQNKDFPLMTNSLGKITSVDIDMLSFAGKHIEAWKLGVSMEDFPELEGFIYAPVSREEFLRMAKSLWASKNTKLIENFYKTFADVQSSYACNAYVCQGLTKKKVFVDYYDLQLCTRESLLLRQKLFYVMTSRASHELYIKVKP